MSKPNSPASASRRAWRRDRSKAMAVVLQGMAALEGVTLPASLDVGMLRHLLVRRTYLSSSEVNVVLSRAAREFEAANPKPR